MYSLDKDLQIKKNGFDDFFDISLRVLQYIPNVLSHFETKGYYKIYSSDIAGTKKYVRPINTSLFIQDVDTFKKSYDLFKSILERIKKRNEPFSVNEQNLIDKIMYTIQQSIGAGLDLLVEPNSAKKHAGNRFEELIRSFFTESGISNKSLVLQIQYDTEEGKKVVKCQNDLILSSFNTVKSTHTSLHPGEVVVSVKTTSKDRMGKMFIDKILLERFAGRPQKVIGIFLNDVQRKESKNISYTLVSGQFMIYTKLLTELEGIYYIDPPPNAFKEPYRNYMRTFSQLVTEDIWKLLSP